MLCLMALTLRRVTLAVFVVNFFLTCYTIYIFMAKTPPPSGAASSSSTLDLNAMPFINSKESDDWNPWGSDFAEGRVKETPVKVSTGSYAANETVHSLEIWSKAAIGFYLWEHILKGKIDKKAEGGIYLYGFKRVKNFKVKFRSGPSLTIHSLRHFVSQMGANEVKNVILVLNGRSEEKVAFAKNWLNEVKLLSKTKRINVGLLLLGNESCFNHWVKAYLQPNGGPVKFLFVVYDWKKVDNEVTHQWPLGVATYRNFPNPDPNKLDPQLTRPYICNFLGTLYNDSSRVEVVSVLKHINDKYSSIKSSPCFVKTRSKWEPSETRESLQLYLEALRFSDLTLNPIGMNHECYRIYEALSYGSLPVVEENISHVLAQKSACDQFSAYRLLKKYEAPLIYVKNWTQELPQIIESEMRLSVEEKVRRRHKLMQWYINFKLSLRDQLLAVIEDRFFTINKDNG